MNAIDINLKIDEAIKKFGEYSMHDKGACEVMDIGIIVQSLENKNVETISSILVDVLDTYKDESIAQCVVDDIISSLDHLDEFEEILDSDSRFFY
jgi:hypothetical protein